MREVATGQDPRVSATTPVVPLRTRGLPTRPIAPDYAQVYLCAGVIVKIHAPYTDAMDLARRLYAVSGPDVERCWVQPLVHRPLAAPGNRLGTVWPRVTVLSAIEAPPWTDAGRLLARLHRAPLEGEPPAHGGLARLRRSIDRLHQLATERGDVRLSWLAELGESLLPELATQVAPTWVHGDFHLGQLGHTVLRRSWKLLDIDDVGTGDPAWDLARVAGFWACGLLDDQSWTAFLEAYREAGGPGVPASGDPWSRLDLAARAAILIATVQSLRAADGEDTVAALLAACRRMDKGLNNPAG